MSADNKNEYKSFPPQALAYNKKSEKWRKACVDYICDELYRHNEISRRSKKDIAINYKLYCGELDLKDVEKLLTPVIPDGANNVNDADITIQHYPIVNKKIELLCGEELFRKMEFNVTATDYNTISSIEEDKRKQLYESVINLIKDNSISDEEFQSKVQEQINYFSFKYTDARELRANILLDHYYRKDEYQLIFNNGFFDAFIAGEEYYMCSVYGGEPHLEKLDPLHVYYYSSEGSNNIEDADMVLLEDYFTLGKIQDMYFESLSENDMHKLTEQIHLDASDDDYLSTIRISDLKNGRYSLADSSNISHFDKDRKIRVLRVFWKSKRRIKKITRFDITTGQEVSDFYPETYIAKKDLGEKEEILWINEAWEGTKLGKDIYVNVRPKQVQYNTISNPSKCHFGIIGSRYAINNFKTYSIMDMAKPYSYLYDVIHYRLNKMLAKNRGKLLKLDTAFKPSGYTLEDWLYYAKVDNILLMDSFNSALKGPATGKIAGGLNNAANGIVDMQTGEIIVQYINLLNYISEQIGDIIGISRQREGQISTRETVGAVERATLQSSHITECRFALHENIKRRVLNCVLETAKFALKGQSVKFKYILPDMTQMLINIDGDEFAESDYGLLPSRYDDLQKITQQIESVILPAMQNQMLDFSTVLKLFTSTSIAEKLRIVENKEREKQEEQQQIQQQQQQFAQQQQQMMTQQQQLDQQLKQQLNLQDNDTKIKVAQIQANAQTQSKQISEGLDTDPNSKKNIRRDELNEKKREFDIQQNKKNNNFKNTI